jgi:hypothetical protein
MNPAPAATPAPRWTTRPSRPQSEGHQQQPSVTVLGFRIELLAVLVVLWCWARLAGPLGVGAALVVVAAVLGGLLPPAGTIRVADWQYAGRGYSTPAAATAPLPTPGSPGPWPPTTTGPASSPARS